MPIVRPIAALAGVLIAAFSAAALVYGFSRLVSGGQDQIADALIVIIFYTGTGAAGVYLTWISVRRSFNLQNRSEQDIEGQIFALAQAENGRLTVAETAAHCGLSTGRCKSLLDRLVVEGASELQVTKEGVLVYVFHGFLSDAEKAAADDF